ncbi:phosphoribosylformylglycinamidine synthase subunit PurQ [Weissella diestrammenae]|uniref:Phosphoribosylformylglycinamidine synthase subunit PurQ n=1 Tax=Weissella diestrammenae TaxID=1162633 RepID=A0A7G9T452_9LACO|nr:phosphoribosylformylglycinamidine synthase subunit PurQ [Weissella diestrammenae]MCM0583399.1 phosphoribosylformylglycinamidine synthase subunit PurQ [Weissella diestrammenae]QNN74877.1 phosphoribosylformylglycinamidine synthase subunit PurQ [Weissella diestrammenae]
MKAAVVRFPGSNCDFDMYYALTDFNIEADIVSEKTQDLSEYDAIFLPGGFSYGDYLRSGAVARFAPVMAAVIAAAEQGKIVVGICNGFQILTEAGLLPGQLMANKVPGFICDTVPLLIENDASVFTQVYAKQQQPIMIPIAHGEGRYYADEQTIAELYANHQVIFKYQTDVNGSVDQIAGITNRTGNVLGMMPHPERAVDALLGATDGRGFFKSIIASLALEVVGK